MNVGGDPEPTSTPRSERGPRACCSVPEAWGSRSAASSDRTSWWAELEPSWRDRLNRAGRDRRPADAGRGPGTAPARSHRLQCHADLDRVHPSWWLRALQDESPAVSRLIAAHGPVRRPGSRSPPSRVSIQEDRVADLARNADATGWVLALWTERLVGGEPAVRPSPRDSRPWAASQLPCSTGFAIAIGVAKHHSWQVIRKATLADRPAWRTQQALVPRRVSPSAWRCREVKPGMGLAGEAIGHARAEAGLRVRAHPGGVRADDRLHAPPAGASPSAFAGHCSMSLTRSPSGSAR